MRPVGVERCGLFGLGVVREERRDRGGHGRSPLSRPGVVPVSPRGRSRRAALDMVRYDLLGRRDVLAQSSTNCQSWGAPSSSAGPARDGSTDPRQPMSLRSITTGDTLRRACRSSRAGRATWSSTHVARPTYARRHTRPTLSPFASSSIDKQAVERRLSRGPGATMLTLACRSALLNVVPHPLAWCPTCSRLRATHVSPGDMPSLHQRQAGPRMSLLARTPLDLVAEAGRPTCPRIQPLSSFSVRWLFA